MSIAELLLFLHVISAFWYVIGLSAVQMAYVRATQSTELGAQVSALEEASHFQGVLLVPGAIAVGASGLFYWVKLDYEPLETGFLLALEGLYLATLFVCLPVIGMALRRARIASLKARRAGKSVPELEEALRDSVPLVFGGLATIILVAMAFISVSRPF
jgi:uncharacterized membrane protein